MVTEDGRELYAVSSEFNVARLLRDPWRAENVWPSLPRRKSHQRDEQHTERRVGRRAFTLCSGGVR